MSPAPMFNRDFGPRSEKMMERDAISAAMIQSLRPAEAATFARPPQPHAPSGSGQGAQPWTPWSRSDIDPATSNSLSAHGTDNSPSASEGDPRPSRPVLPIPNLDRKLRPLLRTPCRVDHSQRETYPSIYPAAGPGTTSAINTQTLQPLQPVQSQQTLPPLRSIPFIKDLLPPRSGESVHEEESFRKRPAVSGHEEESLSKRRYVQQDAHQDHQTTQQGPVITPRSQMPPSGFSTAIVSHGTESQYRVEPQASDREASSLEPRTQYAGQAGWNGQYASTQGHRYQTPAYYSYGRGQTATPAPQESYSQGNYHLDAAGTPGPFSIPRSEHNAQSQMTYRHDGIGAQALGSYPASQNGQQHSGQQMSHRQDGASAASTYLTHNGQNQAGHQDGTGAPGSYTIVHHTRQPPINYLEDGTSAAGTYIAPRPASTK